MKCAACGYDNNPQFGIGENKYNEVFEKAILEDVEKYGEFIRINKIFYDCQEWGNHYDLYICPKCRTVRTN